MAFGRTLKSGKQRKVPVSLQLNESNVKIEVCKKTALDKSRFLYLRLHMFKT